MENIQRNSRGEGQADFWPWLYLRPWSCHRQDVRAKGGSQPSGQAESGQAGARPDQAAAAGSRKIVNIGVTSLSQYAESPADGRCRR